MGRSRFGTTLPHALGGAFGGRQRKQFVTLLTLSGHRDGNDQNREWEFN